MCGIAGIISNRDSAESRTEAVERMCAAMVHRGPDDSGIESLDEATLGVRRLAIFDPANGHQPMSTPDGRYTIAFNGAIFNFALLASELADLGWGFRTRCDTEVLLAAYAQWGQSCLLRLRGMFSFAVWDRVAHSLFLARGPFGIKPLYYHWRNDGSLFFASELRALLASRGMPAEIEPNGIGAYLAHLSVPAPETIYRRIRCLCPGQSATWIDGRFSVKTYFSLDENAASESSACTSYGDFVGELRYRLEDTIQAHSIADVPVGAFLSGGMDSSAIVGLMSRYTSTKLKTFTMTFNESEYSERNAARRTSELFGTEHRELLLTGEEVAQSLPTILAKMDQPTGDGINTYFVSRLAAQNGVKVVLSGLGGDELFGGYPSFRQVPGIARYLPLWRSLPHPVRSIVLRLLRRKPTVRMRKLSDFLRYARDLHEVASLQRMVFADSVRLPLLEPATRASVARLGPFHPMLNDFAFEFHKLGPMRSVCAWELRTYMSNVLLADADVFSMANSIELRVPYIDSQLVSWLWAQPEEFVFSPGRYKRALADSVRDLLPATVREQAKLGFLLPFSMWMNGALRPFMEECFSRSSLDACPWLEPKAAQALWRNYTKSKDTRNWSRVWSLAMLLAFVNTRAKP
jgi:asparagine synthase (glutamine-hydrolysing)